MSAAGWIGWALAGWAIGALAVISPDVRLSRNEIPLLLAWPITVPFFAALRAWRHWRYTCPDCHGFYGDREHYDLHMKHRTNCPKSGGESA